MVVRSDAPWKTLGAFIDYARDNPGKVRIGNSGTGSHTHFAASALFASGDAKVISVPFGEGQAIVNLLGGRIEGVVQLPAAVVAHVKSGDLRVLAMLGAKRDPLFPDVPTAMEQGFPVVLDMWRGIAAPEGTPRPVIARLQEAYPIRLSQSTCVQPTPERSIGFTLGLSAGGRTSALLIASDDAKLAQMMDELGLKKK